MVREAADKKSKQHPGQITCGQKNGKICQTQLPKWTIEKPKLDNARMLRDLIHRSDRCRVQGNHLKRAEKVGSSDASSHALQDQEKHAW